jgi:hypothetical protein
VRSWGLRRELVTLAIMADWPAGKGDGFDVVVGTDGTVPAEELARHGVGPGDHLRVMIRTRVDVGPDTQGEQGQERPRKSMRGALAHTVTPEAVDALIAALAETKAGGSRHSTSRDTRNPLTPEVGVLSYRRFGAQSSPDPGSAQA